MINTDKVDLLSDEFSSLKIFQQKLPVKKPTNHVRQSALLRPLSLIPNSTKAARTADFEEKFSAAIWAIERPSMRYFARGNSFLSKAAYV